MRWIGGKMWNDDIVTLHYFINKGETLNAKEFIGF
jgi:hypothetical protein